ncbi:DUF3147 family protein [Terriglobus sp. 2YAB30_2]|uniref:DUF3147 family protein n=1 Tax=unclassified Terriglobus TaxID=2628988 RepID=UPI003F972425
MSEYLIRFVIGGAVVTAFAMVGDVLRPKSFAGLFGAAPSVALATLGLTIRHQGAQLASIEARSMIFGAIAFLLYAAAVSWWLRRFRGSAVISTVCLVPLWFLAAFSLIAVFGGSGSWSR